jgi:O-methyltransferase
MTLNNAVPRSGAPPVMTSPRGRRDLRWLWKRRYWLYSPAAVVWNSAELLGAPLLDRRERWALLSRFARIQWASGIACGHRFGDLAHIARTVLELRAGGRERGVIVECGCWAGASTAKLSLVARRTGWKLYVADSFSGLPDPGPGDDPLFRTGLYRGSLESVRENVRRLGTLEPVTFLPGWFEETLPAFPEPEIDIVFIDVDLQSSMRTCIRYLYPRLRPGGFFFTHEAHLESTAEAFGDRDWWRSEMGSEPPPLVGAGRGLGLGKEWIAYITKPALGG